MIESFVNTATRLTVRGWAADTTRPDLGLNVVVSVDGAEVARLKANEPSEVLRRAGKYGQGKHAFTYAFHPPLSHDEAHEIVVSTAADGAPLKRGVITLPPIDVAAARQAIADSDIGPLTPVFVTFAYRSGSTMLMTMLGEHPEIVIGNVYPLELEIASYYAKCWNVLTRMPHPGRKPALPPAAVGSNPYFDSRLMSAFESHDMFSFYFQGHAPEMMGETFRTLTDDFYRCLAKDTGRRARCFAEKLPVAPNYVRRHVRALFGESMKEIVLIRDLRDVYSSRQKFHGALLDRELGPELVISLRESAEHLVEIAENPGGGPAPLLLRYEEMVADPAAAFARVLDYLDLPAIQIAGTDEALFARHATSKSPAESVGRWVADLSDEEKALCHREFDGYLSTFGYA